VPTRRIADPLRPVSYKSELTCPEDERATVLFIAGRVKKGEFSMSVVLLVDDDLAFLETRAEFLTEAGYEVILASTVAEAERQMSGGHIHLAVLDIRLVDNFDPKDTSGLSLAKHSDFRRIPKIMQTDYPSFETVREALSADLEGMPPAVEYVDKSEGAEALVLALDKSFKRHVRRNESLVIHFGERDLVSFYNLATLLDPTCSGEKLANYTAELRDIFCQLFYRKTEIRIDRLLWKSEGRTALIVYAFAPGKHVQAQVVVCGHSEVVMNEARRYQEFAPEAPGASGTVLVRSSETLHFAANVYALAGTNIENVYTLAESYRECPEKTFKLSLENLFTNTLEGWQLGKSIPDDKQSPATFYREELCFGKKALTVPEVRQRISDVAQQLPRLGLKIEDAFPNLTIRFGNKSFSYPDPVSYLHNTFSVEPSRLLVNTPGILTGSNILVDQEGRTWLTEFAQAGPKPLLWNHAAMEAVVRFDWVESNSIAELYELETVLTGTGFNKISACEVAAQLRKPLRVIQEIRRLAYRANSSAWMEYQLGLFYHAAHRLMALNPSSRLTDKELAKMAHVILAQAMICGSLSPENGKSPVAPRAPGIFVDHADHAVWVEGKRIHLSSQSYDLLRHLDMRKGELCTRQELIERVMAERYDATDTSQQSRLNTSIYRLRREIENDPDNPRYLLNERKVGYRLVS
jgi:DNA-binding response OmpR family regulator